MIFLHGGGDKECPCGVEVSGSVGFSAKDELQLCLLECEVS